MQAALQQPGDDLAAARGRAAHVDQPQPRAREHAAEHGGEDFFPSEGRDEGCGGIDDDGDKDGDRAGAQREPAAQPPPGGDEQRQVDHKDHGADGQAEQVVEQRGRTGDAAGGDLIGCGEYIDRQRVQHAARQIQRPVQQRPADGVCVFPFYHGHHLASFYAATAASMRGGSALPRFPVSISQTDGK